jgi:hypothetical protein
MDRESRTPRPPTADLNDREKAADPSMDRHTAHDALIAWDELDEQLLRMLAEDPERGRRLRKLQDADGWLRARAAEAARKTGGPALLECPEAEELYDFGQGPGATTLSQARQDAIDRHLATCRECEAFVETLTSVPVPPLVLGMPAEEIESEPMAPAWVRPTPIHPIQRKGPRRLWVGAGLAAAAAVVAMIAIQSQSTPALQFPKQPVLRGSAGGPILFPRGNVLLPSVELQSAFPALDGSVAWQVESVKGASEYKLRFTKHNDSAFGGDEKPIASVDATQPSGTWNGTLVAGNYTVSATAVVHGLPEVIGPRDFEAKQDAGLERRLLALKGEPEPKRTLDAIAVLDELQYWNDARALARTLPDSPERDRYLSQIPGR